MIFCIAKEKETGIKIIVDGNSLEVTVCNEDRTFSNGYDAVLVSKSLLAIVDGKFRTIYVSEETLEWLKSNKMMVDEINYEKNRDNNVRLMSGGGHAIEGILKEHGWTNKRLNDIYMEAEKNG